MGVLRVLLQVFDVYMQFTKRNCNLAYPVKKVEEGGGLGGKVRGRVGTRALALSPPRAEPRFLSWIRQLAEGNLSLTQFGET